MRVHFSRGAGVPGRSQPRIIFHTGGHASVGAYRAVTNWLSFVVATNSLPRGCSNRIGAAGDGKPYTRRVVALDAAQDQVRAALSPADSGNRGSS